MATKEVRIDGTTYDISYTDDADLAVKLAKLESSGRVVQPIESSTGQAALHGAGQGLTFGFSDELYGRWKQLTSDEDYETARDNYRADLDQYRSDHPAAFTGSEIAAGMILPGGTGKAALTGARGLSTGARVARLAGAGAATSGLAGAGYSEGETVGEVLGDAGSMATLGAIANPALSYGLPLITNPVGKAFNAVTRGPQGKATDLVADTLRAGGSTADDVMRHLDELGPASRLIDVGDNTVGLGMAVTGRSEAAGELINKGLAQRQLGAQRRIMGAIDDASGTLSDEYGAVKTALKGAKATNSQIYKSFVNTAEIGGEGAERVKEMLEYDLIKPIFERANKAYQLKTGAKWDGEGDIPLWIVNKMKKYIDRAEGRALNPLDPDPLAVEDALSQGAIKREMVGIADEAVPIYGHARDAVKGPARLLESLKQGKKTKSSEAAIEKTTRMMDEGISGEALSPGEQTMLRMGVARRLRQEVMGDSREFRNHAGALMNGAGGRAGERLEMVSRSENDRRALSQMLNAEDRFAKVRSRLSPMSGSETAHKLAAMERADAGAGALNTLADVGTGGGGTIFQSLKEGLAAFRLDDETATIVARTLMERPTREAVEEMFNKGIIGKDMADSILGLMESGATTAITGGMLAPISDEMN